VVLGLTLGFSAWQRLLAVSCKASAIWRRVDWLPKLRRSFLSASSGPTSATPTYLSEWLVTMYQMARHHIPDDIGLHEQRCENIKSSLFFFFSWHFPKIATRAYHLVMTFRRSVSISSAPTGSICVKLYIGNTWNFILGIREIVYWEYVKLYIGNFTKICLEIINLMKIGQKCPSLSM
jgi:hypothetical protein